MESNNSQLEKIWIIALGTRGDVQPYIAVGAALARKGYKVTFLTHNSFTDFAENYGMRGVPVRRGIEEDTRTRNDPKLLKAMVEGSGVGVMQGIFEDVRVNAPDVCNSVVKEIAECGIPDLCLVSTLSQYFGFYMEDQHNVPFLIIRAQAPESDNPDTAFFGLPRLPFHLDVAVLLAFLVPSLLKALKAHDDYLQTNVIGRYKKFIMRQGRNPSLPSLTLVSPTIAKELYSNEPKINRFVAAAVLNREQQWDRDDYFGGKETFNKLERFLEQGSKPLYIGWGSMMVKSPKYMVEHCIRALHHAKQRAVVLGGLAELSQEVLERTGIDPELIEYAKKNVLFVKQAPHEWLFQRVSVIVHHGGAGTTTAALRSGVPTIITPVLLDQFDWSYLIRKLQVGHGFKKPFYQISWQELGEVIDQVVSSSDAASRAADFGAKLRAEDGSSNSVDEIEGYWNEWVLSGKFHDMVPPPRTHGQRGTTTTTVGLISVAAIVGAAAFVAARFYRNM
jgi:sterol 3beta-glucosyltransferase